jgi:hypothetical protein
MKQLRVDKYHVLNISPPEYHKMVHNTDFQFFLDFLIIDDYDNFRLPTRDEYIHIYNRTNYIIDNYQYLTSSPITKRIHRFASETTTIGYIDTFYIDYLHNRTLYVYNSVDFIDYKIIPVQLEYKPTLLGKLCNILQEFAIMMIMSY